MIWYDTAQRALAEYRAAQPDNQVVIDFFTELYDHGEPVAAIGTIVGECAESKIPLSQQLIDEIRQLKDSEVTIEDYLDDVPVRESAVA